ncbi:MAG: methyltransferase domain-containing protein [Candidatus Beckwithbacteria bacterium]
MNQDSAKWRKTDYSRPWYQKAIELLPNINNYKVLELGSGHGELAKVLTTKTKNLTLTDYSSSYVAKLQKEGYRAHQADFNRKLPFKSKSFDFIISLEVIEHLSQAETFLTEIHRILKSNGKLIISTPNIAWWGYRLFMLLGHPPKKEGYHLRFFTYRTLTKLLNKSDFKIIKDNSFTTIPFVNRILPKPIYPTIHFWPNLLTQDLVFLCQKK